MHMTNRGPVGVWGQRYANMCSMTSQGHPYARFRRALATGNARIAEAAARDLEHVSLADSLTLCLLYRDDPERYERARRLGGSPA